MRGIYKNFIPVLSFLAIIALLAACAGGGQGSSTPTPQSTTSRGGAGGTPTARGIQLGPQPCPDAVKDPAHWDALIPTQSGVSKVEAVTCGYLTGAPILQAVIMVRYSGVGSILDVYVYTNIADPSPQQLFKLQGLYHGDVKISLYNTLMTAEVDRNSSINNGKNEAGLSQDLYREFATGTFAPVSFPGIFPDFTRYQAEQDQAQVNKGFDTWKLSPTTVASRFAATASLLNWQGNLTTTVVSGGNAGDTETVVSVKGAQPGTGAIVVTLQRLEGNTNGGIWEVTAAASDGMAINTPKGRDLLGSPISVSGNGSAFEGKIGTVVVLDHTLSDIGHATATGATGNGATTFSASVNFTSTFKTGYQDGLLALFAANSAGGPAAGAVLVKELLR